MFENWYEISPADFIFSVKAPQSITHYKQFHNCRELLDDLYAVCTAGLREKMGALLFQFPPRFSYTRDKLLRIINNLGSGITNVLEFRHASWWNKDVFDALQKAGISFCGSSIGGLPDDAIVTAPAAYYRFHGIPDLYRSPYSANELQKVADAFLKLKNVETVYCYFNNTAEKGAIDNAQWFEQYVSGQPGKDRKRTLPLPGLFK